ncbi:hypothetical protein B0129_22655 [Salmonella enterica subsp. enterica serovar Kentucky]|nr:hypothetical protein [Salmonella enterica subsp. enterica serovar Kentucky]
MAERGYGLAGLGIGKVKSVNQYRLTPGFGGFTPVPYVRHCCKVSDEAAFCLIQRPYISKTLLTRRISPRGSP